MKILLSAYACRPNHGSEPAVGWNWAIEIAKLGHEVQVLTRNDNRPFIEAESTLITDKVHFTYYDLPNHFLWMKKLSIYFYYTLWQLGAYLMIKKNKENYDIIHHITYVSFRFPIFLHLLKGKFILGPIAGGEESSPNLTSTLPVFYKIIERVRTCFNYLNRFNLFINHAYARANKIYVTTDETFSKIPSKYHYKTKISPAIGVNSITNSIVEKHEKFTILYAGQLLHWKGVHIAIESYAKALKINPYLHFKIIGSGKFKKYLHRLVTDLKIEDKIEFIEKLPQKELFDEYKRAHLFLFPSLHDSGGFVVIEAMSFSLPVICLDKGGPPYFVGKDSRNVIGVTNKNIDHITSEISSLIIENFYNQELLKKESFNIKLRSQEFEWSKVVKNVYF
ncbi:MAG TPA: glycosyltransferase [Cytophagaceae bacterium]|jgi:glycosyltransferase involved in cell wall biosynthesis|nr:glycosyltransferase [Cytophagaceae bacterium]